MGNSQEDVSDLHQSKEQAERIQHHSEVTRHIGCHCKPARKAGVYKKQDHPYHHPIARGGRFGDGPLCKQIKSHKIQDDR